MDSKTILLNKQNFVNKKLNHSTTSKKKLNVVAFVVDWCGYCRSLKPIYNELSLFFYKYANFYYIDCDSNNSVCKMFDIKGYPTIIYFDSQGDVIKHYTGDRTFTGMMSDIIPRIK
ncbi:MAG TPA: protein disulfide isomerase family protein [Allocoleopsis sp.]